MKRHLKPLRFLVLSVALSIGFCACSHDDGPYPYGIDGLGNYCASNYDCASGFCCTSGACGHGTCTYRCARDLDCPYGTLCEEGACFVACRAGADCFAPQKCKARGVCQY